MSDYNTLQKVVQFVLDAQAQQKSVEVLEEKPTDQSEILDASEGNASIRRRVPVAVLRPRIDLCYTYRDGIGTGIACGHYS